jgi:hypothetical protein
MPPSWDERTNGVREARVSVLELLDQLAEEVPNDELSLDGIERIRSVVNVAEDYLNGSNPQLVSDLMLGKLGGALANTAAWVAVRRSELTVCRLPGKTHRPI